MNPKINLMNKRIFNNSENLSNETKTTFHKKWLPKVNALSDDYLLSLKVWRSCGDSQLIDHISTNNTESKSHQNIETFAQKLMIRVLMNAENNTSYQREVKHKN
jgi:hypothetical protein